MQQTCSEGGFIIRVIEGIKMKDNLKSIKTMECERKAVSTAFLSKVEEYVATVKVTIISTGAVTGFVYEIIQTTL